MQLLFVITLFKRLSKVKPHYSHFQIILKIMLDKINLFVPDYSPQGFQILVPSQKFNLVHFIQKHIINLFHIPSDGDATIKLRHTRS